MDDKNNMKMVRLFVSINMPNFIVQKAKQIQKELEKLDLFEGSCTTPEQMHSTLCFIGQVPEKEVEKIEEALSYVRMPKIEIKTEKVGVFRIKDKIKIIYLGFVSYPLYDLVGQIERALLPWVQPETRTFTPHITLVRVKKVYNSRKLIAKINEILIYPETFMIDFFVLKQSVLLQSGAEHFVVKRYELS